MEKKSGPGLVWVGGRVEGWAEREYKTQRTDSATLLGDVPESFGGGHN